MQVILVAGTWGYRDLNPTQEWWWPSSAFAAMVKVAGHTIIGADCPYVWTTNLNGAVVGQKDVDWQVGGANLFSYAVPPLCPDKRIPSDELLIVAHSHGLQPALYAFARGMKGRLISVCSPVREDMMAVARMARTNISKWVHTYSECDETQVAGELCDGHLGIVRPHRLADVNLDITPLGHGDLVNLPVNYPRWADILKAVA